MSKTDLEKFREEVQKSRDEKRLVIYTERLTSTADNGRPTAMPEENEYYLQYLEVQSRFLIELLNNEQREQLVHWLYENSIRWSNKRFEHYEEE